jgi:hypothetical protein
LYGRHDCTHTSVTIHLPLHHEIAKHMAVNAHMGEITSAEVTMSDGAKFVLDSVYINTPEFELQRTWRR